VPRRDRESPHQTVHRRDAEAPGRTSSKPEGAEAAESAETHHWAALFSAPSGRESCGGSESHQACALLHRVFSTPPRLSGEYLSVRQADPTRPSAALFSAPSAREPRGRSESHRRGAHLHEVFSAPPRLGGEYLSVRQAGPTRPSAALFSAPSARELRGRSESYRRGALLHGVFSAPPRLGGEYLS
jgi:hypothetical protein